MRDGFGGGCRYNSMGLNSLYWAAARRRKKPEIKSLSDIDDRENLQSEIEGVGDEMCAGTTMVLPILIT